MKIKGFRVIFGVVMIAVLGFSKEDAAVREWISVKRFFCANVEKRDRLMDLFDAAWVPALNRQGAKKVGVFWTDGEINEGNTNYNTTVFMVVAFPDLGTAVLADRQLLADAVFMRDAEALFRAPMRTPFYESSSSVLLQAFSTCPTVEPVAQAPERLLQLRIYNSYTLERNAKKIAMFESGGEINVFRACGMPPVFFGEAMVGENLPNLTYLLAFENKAAKDAAWATFKAHPAWLKLKADPQYKDTANKITNIVLRPSKGSQL